MILNHEIPKFIKDSFKNVIILRVKEMKLHGMMFIFSGLDEIDEEESFVDQNLPKSLNSDISYFGVGGKQAIFFIGTSTRVSLFRLG
jgi:hypothetical protein